jgi:hypothetical protein
MAITALTSVVVLSPGANGPQTTAAIDTTAATMIELTVSWYSGASGYPTISDSEGNTFVPHGVIVGVGASLRKWYVSNPTVSATHTFTVNHTGGYAALWARTYSGTNIEFDVDAVPSGSIGTTHPSAQSFNSGSLTPSANGALITSAMTHIIPISGLGVTGGPTLIAHHNHSPGANVGTAIADYVQGTAATVNPLWSWSTNAQVALTTVAYVEGVGSPGSPGAAIDSQNNLLTGLDHLVVRGSNNLLVGTEATVDEADLVALFSLDGDPHTEDRDRTFCVHAENICLNATSVEINGSPVGGDIALDDLTDVVITSPATDDVLVYDGAQWVNGPVPTTPDFWLFPFTAPVDGDFAWVNQGGASVSTFDGGLYLEAPTNASIGWRVRKKAAPSTPYVITAAIIPQMLAVSFHRIAMLWRDNAGLMITAELSYKAATQPPDLIINRWNSATSHNGTTQVGPSLLGQPHLWFIQIADDGANRTAAISFNGLHFTTFYTQTRTTFLTATEVGFGVDPNNATYKAGLSLVHWDET